MSATYIGLMSGTSLDSVDAVAVAIAGDNCQLIAADSYPLTKHVRQQILDLTQPGDNEIERSGALDVQLGKLFADCSNQLIDDYRLDKKQIRAIGSHGQTVRHCPETTPGFTLQIGDPNTIAEQTGITTVADFRRRDMAAGGQGAPLVPAFHKAVFHTPHRDRFVINIGGMANLTRLPAKSGESVTGFDTGPGNILMDSWIQQHLDKPYDAKGDWASSGQCDEALLNQLLSLPWLKQPAPRSTGREQFNIQWLQQQLNQLDKPLAAVDVQATVLEYTACTISEAIQQQPDWQQHEVFLCGGGAHNSQLKKRLAAQLNHALSIQTTAALGIDPDWVEAIAFAWLASRTLEGLSGNLREVTGASGERILGAVWPA